MWNIYAIYKMYGRYSSCSRVVMEGSVDQAMRGKHYRRGVRCTYLWREALIHKTPMYYAKCRFIRRNTRSSWPSAKCTWWNTRGFGRCSQISCWWWIYTAAGYQSLRRHWYRHGGFLDLILENDRYSCTKYWCTSYSKFPWLLGNALVLANRTN